MSCSFWLWNGAFGLVFGSGLCLWGLVCTQNNVWKSQSVNVNVSESPSSLRRGSALNVGQEQSLLAQRSKSSGACKEHYVVLCVWCFLVCDGVF